MSVQSSTDSNPITLRIVGRFDPAAMQQLQDAIEVSRTTCEELVVDLSHMEALPDRTMPILSQTISSSGGRVHLRGLGEHQMRILRYLGVEP